jgi:Tripartite tricarboxylate transporter TctB family
MVAIRSPREFYAGAIYIAFGILGLWFGWMYPMGTTGRMGGGYFPKVLSCLLILFGVIALFRGVTVSGEPLAPIRLKPLVLIIAACSLFGLLLQPVGLIGALFLLTVMTAMASQEFRWSPVALAGALGLVMVCAGVFVWGLSVPMPLIGTLFVRS